jgi:hypothetical protein
MALETNSRIPSPYVYQPVDFGGKIDTQAAQKAAAVKAGIQTKKDLKTKNAAALKLEPELTGKAVLNKAIINQYNNILEEYSKIAAAGDNIYDPSTFYGEAFAKDVTALDDFANQMKDVEKDITEIEDKRASDPGIYNYFTTQLREAKLPQDVSNTIVEYRQNKNTLDKAPAIANAVADKVNDAAKNKEIVDITKLGEFDQVNIKNSISDDKIESIFNQTKITEPSQLQEQIFDFKKEKGIEDKEFEGFASYDEYLRDKIKNQIALTTSTNDQLRSQWQINISNRTGNGQKTETGNLVYGTPGRSDAQANDIKPDNIKQIGADTFVEIKVDPSIAQRVEATGSSMREENGVQYINVADLWKFEDSQSPKAIFPIDWIWTNKQNAKGDPNWRPQEGNYTTPNGTNVSGYPIGLIWDQAGNGWSKIKSGNGDITPVIIYPTSTSAYGGERSQVVLGAKRNATQFLTTFSDNKLIDQSAVNTPFESVFNSFNKETGYKGKPIK